MIESIREKGNSPYPFSKNKNLVNGDMASQPSFFKSDSTKAFASASE